MGRERGISDVIAFTLMFTIIVASVAAVSTIGVDQLLELRDREQVNSAERAMEGFAASVDDIQRNGDPVRSVALTLDNGGVWVNESTLSVQYGGASNDIDVNAVHHRLTGEAVTLTYEAGGVFRSDGGMATYEPQFRCSPSSGTAIVSIVNVTTDDSINVAGGGGTRPLDDPLEIPAAVLARDVEQSLALTVERVPTQSRVLTTTAEGPVRIDVSQTAAPEQWTRHLEYKANWQKVADRTFECAGTIDTVVVRVTTVRVSR